MSTASSKLRVAAVSIVSAAIAAVASYTPSVAQLPGIMPGAIPTNIPRPIFKGSGSGSLETTTKDGKRVSCPLKHTTVSAVVSGNITRVTVKQLFSNPLSDKIEAVYVFPLSDTGAVDDMLMKVGSRTIHGTIKKREEAREIYEAARASGHVAALLDQERPNIFTQSVANIEPKKEVEVTISYVDQLPYEAGTYTFAFPTVVGPRFNPGSPAGKSGLGFSPDTTAVPDASKITPHVAPAGERAGHDISISVAIDSPVSISNVRSQLHQVNVVNKGDHHADVSLVNKQTIPNKDFVLTWGVATDQVRSGYLTNGKNGEGYFNLSVMPPKRPRADQVQPKEMVFLIDCSGSQSGKPLEKAKDTMHYALDHMNDNDTFQIISFNNTAVELFSKPQVASAAMRKRAHAHIDSLQAQGGTWMAPAVEKACAIPADGNRLRIVSFMTDGYVGNDFQIIGLIKKLRDKSRWFPFGTGNSVNRFLIDNIAKEGGGEAEYVYLNASAEEVGKKFYQRIASPVLTDVKVEFNGLSVKEVFPREVSDVWAEKPLYITGRYTKPGKGSVTITGFSGGKPYKQELAVEFPQTNAANDVLGSLWARAKVDRLMAEDWLGAQSSGGVNKELKDEIVRTALEHHIMTQYTSFVAVEEQTKTKDGKLVTVEVPVELPDGVSREGVFGEDEKRAAGQPAGSVAYRGRAGHAMRKQSAYRPGTPLPATVPQSFQLAANGPTSGYAQAASAGASMGGGGGMGNVASYYQYGASQAVGGKLLGKDKGGMYVRKSQEAAAPPSPPSATDALLVAVKPQPKNKADSDDRRNEKKEEQNQLRDAETQKLSADLQAWLNRTTGDTATVKVKVTFASVKDINDIKLKGFKVESRKTGTAEVFATVNRDALLKLLKMKTVLTVSNA